MSKQKRLKPAARKEQLLAAAISLAERRGYTHVTREEIARKVGITGSAVQYHFGTMVKLQRDLMRFAVKSESLPIIAQGLAVGDPHALKAPEALRLRAIEGML